MKNSDYISALRDVFNALFGYDGVAIPLLLLSFALIVVWELVAKLFSHFVRPTKFEFSHHFKSVRKD